MALQDYYNTGDNNGSTFGLTTWRAQSFKASSGYSAESVKLLLLKSASGALGTVTVSLRAVDGSSFPTGGDLAVGTTDGNTLTTDFAGEWREITFGTPYELTAEVTYAIVVRALAAAFFGTWRAEVPGTFADGVGSRSTNSGSTWTIPVSTDNMFEVYGTASSTYVDFAATLAVTGGLSANLYYGSVNVKGYTSTKRIVVAGYNSIYYEDV